MSRTTSASTSEMMTAGKWPPPDIQLLQWYYQRRDIRRNLLLYSIVHNAVMDLLANRETPATRLDTPQLLITPALDADGNSATSLTPAVVQHAVPIHAPTHAERGQKPPSSSHTTSAPSPRHSAPSWTAKTHLHPYFPQTTMLRYPTPTS